MGILNKFLKKKHIPDELPDLAIEELKKDLASSSTEETTEKKAKEETTKEPAEEAATEEEAKEETTKEPAEEEAKEETREETTKEPADKKTDSFFNNILKGLDEESYNLSKIKDFTSSPNMVEDMKKYWEQQNDKIILHALQKKFKTEINEHISKLKTLELEWRTLNTNLIEKEEEIGHEERELKKIMRNFSHLYKEKYKKKNEKRKKKKEKS